MPKKYESKTGRTNGSHKPKQPPQKFEVGIIDRMDSRTTLAKSMKQSRDSLLQKMGGEATQEKQELAELFVVSKVMLQNQGFDLLTGSVEKAEVSKWTQSLNAFMGLARMLGIENQSSSLPWIEESK